MSDTRLEASVAATDLSQNGLHVPLRNDEAVAHLVARLQAVDSAADVQLVRRAYAVAFEAHRTQVRASGEPYIDHPVAVAEILLDLQIDAAAIAAALLHDVVEDTSVTLEQIRRGFGVEIAHLVDGVTKLAALEHQSREEVQAGTYRKMFSAMADDPRVVLIKLADRLHNMRTLGFKAENKRRRTAQETLEIYAPLAHRLGIWGIKRELEDLGLRYFNPVVYEEIRQRLESHAAQNQRIVDRAISQLTGLLRQQEIHANVAHRPVPPYEIYLRQRDRPQQVSTLLNELRLRVIVDTVDACYRTLGLVHNLWRPVLNEIADFIAAPKENQYRSLHTMVVLTGGRPCNIQIRTPEMHETAQIGIAAYWRASKRRGQPERPEVKIAWLRSLLEWQRDVSGVDFVETLRRDVLRDQVYVLTPKGRVIDLPVGSTPIDMAYRVHTEIGHTAIGAEVNGEPRPLDYQLTSGDLVKIVTSRQSPGPAYEWLSFVNTATARTQIRRWMRRQTEDVQFERGRAALTAELARLGIKPDFAAIVRLFEMVDEDQLFLSIGRGDLEPRKVATEVLQHRLEAVQPAEQQPEPGWQAAVSGQQGREIVLAQCCRPVPQEPIAGFRTKRGTISVHRRNCGRLRHYADDVQFLDAEWVLPGSGAFITTVIVEAQDRIGLLRDVFGLVAEQNINISSMQQLGRPAADRVALQFELALHDPKKLATLLASISRVPAVYAVRCQPIEVR